MNDPPLPSRTIHVVAAAESGRHAQSVERPRHAPDDPRRSRGVDATPRRSRLYLIGGSTWYGLNRQQLATLQILDMRTRTWSLGPRNYALVECSQGARLGAMGWRNLELMREWAAVGWRGRLYVAGCEPGYAWDEVLPRPANISKQTTDVHCFDPASAESVINQ